MRKLGLYLATIGSLIASPIILGSCSPPPTLKQEVSKNCAAYINEVVDSFIEPTSDTVTAFSKFKDEAEGKGCQGMIITTNQSYLNLTKMNFYPYPDSLLTADNSDVWVIAKILEEININLAGQGIIKDLAGDNIKLFENSDKLYQVYIPVNLDGLGLEYDPIKIPFIYKARIH